MTEIIITMTVIIVGLSLIGYLMVRCFDQNEEE